MNITIAVAIVPALALLWLFKKWDQKRPEPPGVIRLAMILGAVSCVPAAIIEVVMSNALGKATVDAQGGLVNAFLIAAATEEGLKLVIVRGYFFRRPEFNEVMDGILYMAATSLGFALLENILYSSGNLVTGLARAISAVPLHATCSGIMGYFVGVARMRGGQFGRILTGYAIAILIHGTYDWAVFSGGTFGFGAGHPLLGFAEALAIVGVAAIVIRVLVKRALREDDELLGAHSRPLEGPIPAWGGPYGMHPGHPMQHGHPAYGHPYAQQAYGVPQHGQAPAYPPPQHAAPQYSPPQQPYGHTPYGAQHQQPYPQQPQQPYPQQGAGQPYPQQPQQPYPQQPQQTYPQQPQQPYPQGAGQPPPGQGGPGGWPPRGGPGWGG